MIEKTSISSTKNIYAFSLLLLLGFIWGSGYSIARLAMTQGVPPLGYAFWQSIGPAIFTLLLLAATRVKFPTSPTYLKYYLICGLLGIVIPNTNMYFAAKQLPAGIIAVLVNTVPIFTYLFALTFQQESFNLKRCFGVLLAVIGVGMITVLKMNFQPDISIKWGFITLITPVSFALCALYATRYRPENSHTLAVSAGMLVASSLLLSPIIFFSGHFYALSFPLSFPQWLILLEIVLSSLGYIILFQLLKLSGAVHYSLVGGIVALTGLFWGKLIFEEALPSQLLFSVTLILLGIGLVTLEQKTCQNT